MKFTDSQIYFINQSIRTALYEEEKFIKYWTDLAQKENDIGKKRNYNKSVEYCIKRIEELEALRDLVNE
jgi:uncharacterized coiled-coil DUF342 family protein